MTQPTKNDSGSDLARIGIAFEQVELELEVLYETVATEFETWRRRVGEKEYAEMETLVEGWGNKHVWSPLPNLTAPDEIVTLVLVTRRFLHSDAVSEITFQELFAANNAKEFLKLLTK